MFHPLSSSRQPGWLKVQRTAQNLGSIMTVHYGAPKYVKAVPVEQIDAFVPVTRE